MFLKNQQKKCYIFKLRDNIYMILQNLKQIDIFIEAIMTKYAELSAIICPV